MRMWWYARVFQLSHSTINYFYYIFFWEISLFQSLLNTRQSFRSGTMMDLALIKLQERTARSSYSKTSCLLGGKKKRRRIFSKIQYLLLLYIKLCLLPAALKRSSGILSEVETISWYALSGALHLNFNIQSRFLVGRVKSMELTLPNLCAGDLWYVHTSWRAHPDQQTCQGCGNFQQPKGHQWSPMVGLIGSFSILLLISWLLRGCKHRPHSVQRKGTTFKNIPIGSYEMWHQAV